MFSKLKQYKDLRDQAKTLQNALAQENVAVEKNGLKLIMNGNLEITTLTIEESALKSGLNNIVKEAVNDAIKKTQRIMAKKMQEMGGIPGLS
jgi:DNA-binding protein YbaB